jgi:hypothetical protein
MEFRGIQTSPAHSLTVIHKCVFMRPKHEELSIGATFSRRARHRHDQCPPMPEPLRGICCGSMVIIRLTDVCGVDGLGSHVRRPQTDGLLTDWLRCTDQACVQACCVLIQFEEESGSVML